MSLQILSNDQIINKFEYRWPRMCIDARFWEIEKVIKSNPYSNWNEVKFERNNYQALDHLEGQQGIYMFVVKPNELFTKHHTYILYVGETGNLRDENFLFSSNTFVSCPIRTTSITACSDFLNFPNPPIPPIPHNNPPVPSSC